VLLTAKSEALSAIKRIQAAAEKECSRKLRVLRTDNGGEFTANEFAAYCADEGSLDTSRRHTPAAERGGGAVTLDDGGDGAGAPKAAEDADIILGGGRDHHGLPTEPAPDKESRRSHTL
jgi:hypothetical protein